MPKLTKNWHKKWSSWLLLVAAPLALLEPFLPQLQSILPEHWYRYVFPAILLASAIKQTFSDDADSA